MKAKKTPARKSKKASKELDLSKTYDTSKLINRKIAKAIGELLTKNGFVAPLVMFNATLCNKELDKLGKSITIGFSGLDDNSEFINTSIVSSALNRVDEMKDDLLKFGVDVASKDPSEATQICDLLKELIDDKRRKLNG